MKAKKLENEVAQKEMAQALAVADAASEKLMSELNVEE